MTLEHLKNEIEAIALNIDDIKTFDFGEEFLLANDKGSDFGLVFLEIPYSIDYDITKSRKTVQFSLIVLFKSNQDDVKNDHELISNAEKIGDNLIQLMQKKITEFKIESANALSLREFSDDNCAGVRIDLKGFTNRACL